MRSAPLLLLLAALALAAPRADAQTSVSWDVLSRVELVKQNDVFVPRFGAQIQAMQGKEVTLKGFMLPVDQAAQQQTFILSANPVANCFYCLPGGPESLIEVRMAKPVAFSYDPIAIRGRLELLADDPMGMYYRLTQAVAVD